MVDDIRPRELKLPVEENKQPEFEQLPEELAEPAFVPPNLVEEEQGFISAAKSPEKAKQKKQARKRFNFSGISFKDATKKQKIIGGAIAGVLLIAGGGGVFALQKYFSKPLPVAPVVVAEKKAEPPKPTTEASKLTGLQIDPELNKRPITSIQIENSPDARPQAGLKDAGVVFEAIAEGGITRFNASFLEAQPDYIGPVRSVRPYYAVLVAPFDPVFVHAGGSPDGLAKLRDLGLKDMDHGANGNTFRRVSDRYAPHNLYTSSADLDKASASRGYTTSNVKGFARKDEQKGQPVTARVIDLAISSPLYNVHYDYDAASNTYKRVMAGKPHTDHKSGEQIAPKVVVALAMSFSQNGIYSVYQTNGTGSGVVFQDGQAIKITWKKAGDKEQFEFVDEAGKPVKLNAGQTWFTLVKSAGNITFAP
jgi:hypothetical protein